MTMLYWQIGKRINEEVLKDKRAEYGKQIVVSLGRQLEAEYGSGWSKKQLPNLLILNTLGITIFPLNDMMRKLSFLPLHSQG
ncbi:MAG: DUF1016 N-terminal domain-containing protein [bacterium]